MFNLQCRQELVVQGGGGPGGLVARFQCSHRHGLGLLSSQETNKQKIELVAQIRVLAMQAMKSPILFRREGCFFVSLVCKMSIYSRAASVMNPVHPAPSPQFQHYESVHGLRTSLILPHPLVLKQIPDCFSFLLQILQYVSLKDKDSLLSYQKISNFQAQAIMDSAWILKQNQHVENEKGDESKTHLKCVAQVTGKVGKTELK